jgi:hypothetical protein
LKDNNVVGIESWHPPRELYRLEHDWNTMDKSRKNSDVITASEIAQYAYCPISWYLKRSGCQPNTPGMVAGMKKHARVGEKITLVQHKEMASRHFGLLGFIAFIVALLVTARWLL